MRARFLVVFITCLFATFSITPLVVLSVQDCKGPSICAEARVYGGPKLRARARVASPRTIKGRWTYRLVLGGDDPQSDQRIYQKGVRLDWEIEKHTGTASAYASNHGKTKAGKTYYAHASDWYPKDN